MWMRANESMKSPKEVISNLAVARNERDGLTLALSKSQLMTDSSFERHRARALIGALTSSCTESSKLGY